MAYPENNEMNRLELAAKIVSSWSREELEDYVIREFDADYRHAPDIFEETWDDFKDSFDWSEELSASIKKDCTRPGCHSCACEDKKESDIQQWQIDEASNGRR